MKLFGKRGGGRGNGSSVAPVVVNRPVGAGPEWGGGGGGSDESRIMAIGTALLEAARRHRTGLLSARFYQDKLMEWSMKDHAFKVQMFRFVDAFPVLTTPEMVHEHLVDYMSQPGVKPPPGMDVGLRAGGLAKGLLTSTISSQIKGMASQFIAGTDAADALSGLERLWKNGIGFSVDLLGEACVSDEEADAYQRKYLDLVENLPGRVAAWPKNQTLEADHIGPVPRTNVSVKISALSARLTPLDIEGSIGDLMRRLEPILESARDRGVLINFDMEQAALKELTIRAFQVACERINFEAGIAMQAYLRSGVDDAGAMARWARGARRAVTVRLVKGAYWDYETIHAEQMGWPSKVWGHKWETDRCFERMVSVFLDSTPRALGEGGVKLALGSHNVRSIAAALAGLERRGLPRSAVELQMLHGMADQLKHAAAELEGGSLRVREYVPVGEMIPGMAYLVRRLLENTSNESWLRAGFLEGASAGALLAAPGPRGNGAGGLVGGGSGGGSGGVESPADLHLIGPERHGLTPAVAGVGNGRAFFTEPARDFSIGSVREAFAGAIRSARVPAVANDKTPADAAEMVGAARAAFPAWRGVDPLKRSAVLTRAAAAMRARRDELSAIVLLENGKPWGEADAEVCEAIDFLEYYARLAPGLFGRERLGRFIGELDEQWHQPRGVAAVISPWNFPLAICAGMTSAALVTGNTVVVKPAEQTPGIARVMFDILSEALRAEGAPAGVLHLCPGPGETTGAALVRDPRVAVIAFTGSKAVGLDILRAAAVTEEALGQRQVKRVVCEMGGKNAIIVDTSADLDEATLGVRQSAFGYAGQKCSACSRVIVVDPQGPMGPHITTATRRLIASTAALKVGDQAEPSTDVGPVIDDESFEKIASIIAGAEAEIGAAAYAHADVTLGHGRGVGPRRCVGPRIFTGVEPGHGLARVEVFGPVLAVMHAPSFEAAIEMACDHPYRLTGGVFTRKPAHIELAKREFRVGNLYINRGCTGALVGRQPFGGLGLSGVGSKAGGREYLAQFVEPRLSCENTMRRGFAPEL